MNFYVVSEEISYTSSSSNISLPSNRLNNLAVYTNGRFRLEYSPSSATQPNGNQQKVERPRRDGRNDS